MKIPNTNPPIPTVPPDVMIPVISTKPKWLKPTDQIDTWLDAQGFYRKHIARDASSLFRCVSEQIFLTQVHHLTVRKHCIQFAVNQPEVFKQLTDKPVKEYIDRLHKQREWGNTLDMEIISRLYHVDFAMYKEIKKPIEQVTSNGYTSFIMLSLSHERHYDSVYSKQHILNAAICQSILYERLYKEVFKLKEVDYAVNKMLHDKNARYQTELNAAFFTTGFQMRFEIRDNCKNVKELLNYGITPFPYKVAKSLDPNIYRNVEYDTWNEHRRGIRLGSTKWNDRELQEGTKCWVNFKGENDETIKKSGYIQKMSSNKGPVEVYVADLGQKLTVPYESLEVIPTSTSCTSHSESLIEMFGNLSTKMNPHAKGECQETEASYSSNEEDTEPHKMEDTYQPNCVSPKVHYVHSASSAIPTSCYACITSHSYPQENDSKPIMQSRSTEDYPKYSHNLQNTNEMPNTNDQPVPMMQYPISLYPVMSQDVDIPPPIYSSNVLPPKTVSNINETNDNMGNPVRVFYNNNVDYYRYNLPSVPYYVVSPNYIVPLNAESQGLQNTDVSRIQFSPPTGQHQNELIYTMPSNNLSNTKMDMPLYPPMVPYPSMPPTKKPPSRNGTGDMHLADNQFHRAHKDMVYMKEPPPLNPPFNIPQPNAPSANIYPCFNSPYPTITSPIYYHPYDYSAPCYPPCPELPSYADNISPPTYQMPHIVSLPYPEEMYQPNGQYICQPMLPASHN